MGNDKLTSFASRGTLTYKMHGQGAELFQTNPELLEGARAGIRSGAENQTAAASVTATVPTREQPLMRNANHFSKTDLPNNNP